MGVQERETRKTLRRLRAERKLEGRDALAQLAVGLSKALDADDPDATLAGIAAVSKELRATLAALESTNHDVDDDYDAEFRRLMCSEVGDSPEL